MRQVALVLVAVLLLAGCFGGKPAPATHSPTTAPEPVTAAALTPVGKPAHVSTATHRVAEFMVKRDPKDPDHLVTAFGDYDSPGGVLNCAFAVSMDGGATWTVSQPVPGFSGPYLQFDGWIDFDPAGGVDAICLRESGPGATAETWPYYLHSADGGLSWSEAMRIPTKSPDDSTDKSVLAVGRDGIVYAAVSNMVGTTSDGGKTWNPLTPLKENMAVFNGMVADNEGTMFLLGLGAGHDIWLERTSDHGATWTHAAVGPFLIPPGYNDQNRWVDQRPWTALPNVAHDPVTDDLYIVYQSWDSTYGGYKVHLWRSSDHGVSFAETAVPAFKSDRCADPCHVTHPAVAFDLKGRVGLIAQLTKDEGVVKVVQLSASADHGATWLVPIVLSSADGMQSWQNPMAFTPLPGNAPAMATGVAADPKTAHNAALGLGLTTAVSELQLRWNGEYWGLEASSKGFAAMWIDHTENGRPQLWSQVVAVQ